MRSHMCACILTSVCVLVVHPIAQVKALMGANGRLPTTPWVHPDWVMRSIEAGKRLPYGEFITLGLRPSNVVSSYFASSCKVPPPSAHSAAASSSSAKPTARDARSRDQQEVSAPQTAQTQPHDRHKRHSRHHHHEERKRLRKEARFESPERESTPGRANAKSDAEAARPMDMSQSPTHEAEPATYIHFQARDLLPEAYMRQCGEVVAESSTASARPCAVTHHWGLVLHTNGPARTLGIHVGMHLRDFSTLPGISCVYHGFGIAQLPPPPQTVGNMVCDVHVVEATAYDPKGALDELNYKFATCVQPVLQGTAHAYRCSRVMATGPGEILVTLHRLHHRTASRNRDVPPEHVVEAALKEMHDATHCSVAAGMGPSPFLALALGTNAVPFRCRSFDASSTPHEMPNWRAVALPGVTVTDIVRLQEGSTLAFGSQDDGEAAGVLRGRGTASDVTLRDLTGLSLMYLKSCLPSSIARAVHDTIHRHIHHQAADPMQLESTELETAPAPATRKIGLKRRASLLVKPTQRRRSNSLDDPSDDHQDVASPQDDTHVHASAGDVDVGDGTELYDSLGQPPRITIDESPDSMVGRRPFKAAVGWRLRSRVVGGGDSEMSTDREESMFLSLPTMSQVDPSVLDALPTAEKEHILRDLEVAKRRREAERDARVPQTRPPVEHRRPPSPPPPQQPQPPPPSLGHRPQEQPKRAKRRIAPQPSMLEFGKLWQLEQQGVHLPADWTLKEKQEAVLNMGLDSDALLASSRWVERSRLNNGSSAAAGERLRPGSPDSGPCGDDGAQGVTWHRPGTRRNAGLEPDDDSGKVDDPNTQMFQAEPWREAGVAFRKWMASVRQETNSELTAAHAVLLLEFFRSLIFDRMLDDLVKYLRHVLRVFRDAYGRPARLAASLVEATQLYVELAMGRRLHPGALYVGYGVRR